LFGVVDEQLVGWNSLFDVLDVLIEDGDGFVFVLEVALEVPCQTREFIMRPTRRLSRAKSPITRKRTAAGEKCVVMRRIW
jgi:hypothetical protein